MTTVYKCDHCGRLMEYEDERHAILNSVDRAKERDLCPDCNSDVLDFIDNKKERVNLRK